MSYSVYQVMYTLAIEDLDMPTPRFHNVIFVEIEPETSGTMYHVTGSITDVGGMKYQEKKGRHPNQSESPNTYVGLGKIKVTDYPEVDRILRALPTPPKQKHFNIKTMKTEQMKPDGTFYEPGEPRPPMIKCTEWTVNQAIPALYASGILRK